MSQNQAFGTSLVLMWGRWCVEGMQQPLWLPSRLIKIYGCSKNPSSRCYETETRALQGNKKDTSQNRPLGGVLEKKNYKANLSHPHHGPWRADLLLHSPERSDPGGLYGSIQLLFRQASGTWSCYTQHLPQL